MPALFRIYNTLSREVETFEPQTEGKVGLYVCGMTVYDHCHVGHARAMVVFDAFVRYLRHRGWDVTFVRNFTDVDDKIIKRAGEQGRDPAELAQSFIDAFHEDVASLGLLHPTHEPRVTTSIDQIVSMIGRLVDAGHAYAADGSVWFDVGTNDRYGKLSHRKVDDQLSNPDKGTGKRSPVDFALWKAAKPDEPQWDSPWGPGRPGWHIECSAMAERCLGDTIDIHGGGLDLVFPHHENEIAQSECSHQGATYARYWMHNGLLTMTGGQKMGKSLGNVINLRDALRDFPAEAIRLYYLQNQYRSPLPWDENALPEALTMLSRLYEAREKAEGMAGAEPAETVAKQLGADAMKVLELGRRFEKRFHAAVDHDFNTAQGLGHLFELVRALNRFANHKKASKRGAPVVAAALEAFRLVEAALGLMAMETSAFHEEVKTKRLGALGIDRDDVEAKIAARSQARADKDWSRADSLRDELVQMRIEVLDLAAGVTWRVKLQGTEET